MVSPNIFKSKEDFIRDNATAALGRLAPDAFDRAYGPDFDVHEIAGIEAGWRACRDGSERPWRADTKAEWDSRIAAGATPTPVIDWDAILSSPDLEEDAEELRRGTAQKGIDPDELRQYMIHEGCERYALKHAAIETLANDLARKRREALTIALAPPLLALVLGFAAQWIVQGL